MSLIRFRGGSRLEKRRLVDNMKKNNGFVRKLAERSILVEAVGARAVLNFDSMPEKLLPASRRVPCNRVLSPRAFGVPENDNATLVLLKARRPVVQNLKASRGRWRRR
eukprot:Amastigsp_a841637_477.p3 type:complete len:108 gc:universal Amastigsp_a841637_477:625-302(-)